MGDRGFLSLTLESDRSQISYIILALYILLSFHWLYLVYDLSRAMKLVSEASPILEAAGPGDLTLQDNNISISGEVLESGIFSDYLSDLIRKSMSSTKNQFDHSILLEALGEQLMSKHAFGHYACDVLLKLGLLGTIIGFIMMLTPVGELTDFDPNVLQKLLGQMSGGMAVALFTTISGLVTSTLLGLQYQLLDVASVRFINRVATCVEVQVMPLLAQGNFKEDLGTKDQFA